MPLNINFKTYEELVAFLYKEKSLLFLMAINVIKQSIEDEDDIAIIANFSVEDTSFTIRVQREEWAKHLAVSLTYFEEKEDYELCREIKELIDNL